MLRLHTATDSAAVKNYFSVSDYYTQGQEVVGRFGGKLAASLGLEGPVDKRNFDLLCDNRRPDGGPLTPRTNQFRRVGTDMIFSLPKDVGAFIMLLPEPERDAWLERIGRRVDEVMGLIEADVETRVRVGGAFENRPGSGILRAGFMHTTARPVNGQAPDPHPHWHEFVFNATADAEEGRIKAADFATIHRDRSYFEAVFYSLVAGDFERAGYALERRDNGRWGLKGLQPLVQLFSKRTGEIEEEAKRLNVTDAAEKAGLGAKTRSRKQKELTPAGLQKEWLSQLGHGEWDAFDAVRGQALPQAERVTAQQAVVFALSHLSERQSVFPERELVRVALLHGIGQVTPEQIREELPRQGVILQERDGRLMATTAELQREEDFIIGQAHPAHSVAPVGMPEGLSRELEGGKQLNDGQWNAVNALLSSACRVNLIEGPAGAGKSSLLAKFEEGMRLAGEQPLYLATTSKAAEVLQKDGFDAHTLARFLVDTKMQEAARGGRVVVDESSMLGHKDAVRLYRLADELGLKLIHLGDPMQHGSVGRGAFHTLLKQHAGVKPFRLTQILRQKDGDYLRAAELLSAGETLAGLDVLKEKGWVHEIESHAERYRRMASDYLEAVKAGQSVLVVSPTHAEAGRITDAIREALRADGRLGSDEREFSRLVGSGTTEAERGLAGTYRPGQVVQFFQNVKKAAGGYRKGDRLVVEDAKALPLSEAGKFQLYDVRPIRLAEGDTIRFTAPVRSLDGGKQYRNGSVATVAGFDRRGNIRLEGGHVIAKDAGHFRHAFVETSFGAQGQTHQKVMLGMGSASAPAMNREQAYVSLTRGKEQAAIYTDDWSAMRRAVETSSQKLVALDLKPKAEEQPAREERKRASERLRRLLEHRRRNAFMARIRAAWEAPLKRLPVRAPLASRMSAGHSARIREQQAREHDHGR